MVTPLEVFNFGLFKPFKAVFCSFLLLLLDGICVTYCIKVKEKKTLYCNMNEAEEETLS